MRDKYKHKAYGIHVSLSKPLKIGHDGFGQYPNYYSVTENVRLSHGHYGFLSKDIVQKYVEALIPIFNKRYGAGKYEILTHEIYYSNHNTHKKVLNSSEILKWRLQNSNFNPKERP